MQHRKRVDLCRKRKTGNDVTAKMQNVGQISFPLAQITDVLEHFDALGVEQLRIFECYYCQLQCC